MHSAGVWASPSGENSTAIALVPLVRSGGLHLFRVVVRDFIEWSRLQSHIALVVQAERPIKGAKQPRIKCCRTECAYQVLFRSLPHPSQVVQSNTSFPSSPIQPLPRSTTYKERASVAMHARHQVVSTPAAIATELLLMNKVAEKGVIRPVSPQLCEDLSARLEKEVMTTYFLIGLHSSWRHQFSPFMLWYIFWYFFIFA